MSILVVDASVAAKWFFNEDLAEESRSHLRSHSLFYAPDYFLYEMDSLFCKRVSRGELSETDAVEARQLLMRLPVLCLNCFNGLVRTLASHIAMRTGQSFYDCLYLAQAVLMDGRLVTADRRFYDSLATTGFSPYLQWVAPPRQ